MALPKRIIKETERLMAEPYVNLSLGSWAFLQRRCSKLISRICRFVCYSVPGISAVPHEDNLRYFDVEIHGPAQSPYEGPSVPPRHNLPANMGIV